MPKNVMKSSPRVVVFFCRTPADDTLTWMLSTEGATRKGKVSCRVLAWIMKES